MTKAKSSSKAASKKAAKKAGNGKAVTKTGSKKGKSTPKNGANKKVKVVKLDCPDLSNKKVKGKVVMPTVQERLAKKRELQAYLKQERDSQKRTAARRAWSDWFKGKAA